MSLWPFKYEDMTTISEALAIAEDKIGDHYKLSDDQWRRHHYDVRTLSSLKRHQIVFDVFALLHRCTTGHHDADFKTRSKDYYFICLQDHQIMKAIKRDRDLGLLPLLVYVFTHELVHIVRFSNFSQRFEVSGKGKEKEEKIVHATTHDVLKDLPLPRLDYVLESYQSCRICDLATS